VDGRAPREHVCVKVCGAWCGSLSRLCECVCVRMCVCVRRRVCVLVPVRVCAFAAAIAGRFLIPAPGTWIRAEKRDNSTRFV
jgi:hypothetical protein